MMKKNPNATPLTVANSYSLFKIRVDEGMKINEDSIHVAGREFLLFQTFCMITLV